MSLKFRRSILRIAGTAFAYVLTGCATTVTNARVRHGLQIELDKSVGQATNIRYTYGDEFVDQVKPVASSIGAFITYIALMHVPEKFQVSWETANGEKHEATVPVRSSIRRPIANKNIVFVIMHDYVEGYVGVTTRYGQMRERFY